MTKKSWIERKEKKGLELICAGTRLAPDASVRTFTLLYISIAQAHHVAR